MELTQILPQLFDSLPERPVAHHIEEWFIWAHTLVPLPHLPHPPAAPPHTDSPPLPLTCFPFLQFAMNKMNVISSSVWLLILSLLPYRSAALSPSTPPQLPLFMFLTVLKEPICFLFNPHSIVIRFFCFLFCLVLLCTFSVSMSIFFFACVTNYKRSNPFHRHTSSSASTSYCTFISLCVCPTSALNIANTSKIQIHQWKCVQDTTLLKICIQKAPWNFSLFMQWCLLTQNNVWCYLNN